MPDFGNETAAINRGFHSIAGLDEAGRGALFGPVVAAAVIFPLDLIRREPRAWVAEIDDSKRLSPSKRKSICRSILIHARAVGVGWVSNREIDEKNIAWASFEAMRRSLRRLGIDPDFLLVDGFRLNDVKYFQEKIVQGDRKSITIAAASIVAKVLRDEMVDHLDRIFGGYNLKSNKGYGTRAHYSALRRLGPSPLHRRSFNLENGGTSL